MDDITQVSWVQLNDLLRQADEPTCLRLLESEKHGKRRKEYLKRIHSRLNKVRADRERDAGRPGARLPGRDERPRLQAGELKGAARHHVQLA